MIKEFKTSKGEFLGVLVPEEWKEFIIRQNKYQSDLWYTKSDGLSNFISIPGLKNKIIGIASELTEGQAREIVDNIGNTLTLIGDFYPDYIDDECIFETALESFNSLMQKLEMYSENPLGEYPCESGYNKKLKNSCIENCQGSCWNHIDFDHDEWEKAQKRTGKWLIIQKIK